MRPSPTKVVKDGTGRAASMGNERSHRRGSSDLAADDSSESKAASISLERFVLECVSVCAVGVLR